MWHNIDLSAVMRCMHECNIVYKFSMKLPKLVDSYLFKVLANPYVFRIQTNQTWLFGRYQLFSRRVCLTIFARPHSFSCLVGSRELLGPLRRDVGDKVNLLGCESSLRATCDIVSGSNAKIFTFIASTNASLRALHILPRGENDVKALSRSCSRSDESCFTLFTHQNVPSLPNIRHDIRLIKSLRCLILSEGRISVPNDDARNLFALFRRIPDHRRRRRRVVCARSNEMRFFLVHHLPANTLPLFLSLTSFHVIIEKIKSPGLFTALWKTHCM